MSKQKLITLWVIIFPLLFFGCTNETDSFTKVSPESRTDDNSQKSDLNTIKFVEVRDTSGITPDQVFSFFCEVIDQKPEIVSTTCADLGEGVFDIQWDTWSASGATGIGTYSVNQCEPNCAEGIRIEAQVSVALSNLVSDGSRYFLTQFTYQGGSDFPEEYPKTGTWDLSDFYLMMNS